jgi:hypothetical protein
MRWKDQGVNRGRRLGIRRLLIRIDRVLDWYFDRVGRVIKTLRTCDKVFERETSAVVQAKGKGIAACAIPFI